MRAFPFLLHCFYSLLGLWKQSICVALTLREVRKVVSLPAVAIRCHKS